MLSKRSRVSVAAALCATAIGAVATPANAATGPVQRSFVGGISTSFVSGGTIDPQGANDWSCKPSASKPNPVVLVHGTWENKYSNWAYMAPQLRSKGLCVYALNYSYAGALLPLYGTGGIKASGQELATFVDKVLASTGAAKVDLVGHSQGGMMPRAYIKYFGGASKVRNLVSLGATHKGTTLQGIGTLGNQLGVMAGVSVVLGQAATYQVVNSPFLKDLNAGGLTVPGIKYTQIVTKFDEITTPYTNGMITPADNPAGASVTNIVLQNGCGTNFADHLSMSYSARTVWFVQKALGAISSTTPVCDVQLPVF